MARLKTLRDKTRRLGRDVRYLSAPAARVRDAQRPDRAQYKTADWQRLRWATLIRDDFTCQMCGWEHAMAANVRLLKSVGQPHLIKGRAPELVADHIQPHRGDHSKFWNPANLQCLCKRCHDGAKQRAERQE